jgi:DNA-binding PadR family transcriptional regulator
MIELAILGLLDDDDLHGYELRKRLTDLLGLHLAISFGSLYPALGRLERAGYVKAVTTRAAGDVPSAPATGSLTGELAAFKRQRQQRGEAAPARATGGRARKVYGITDAGRERLHALLVDPDLSDDRAFAVRVAFCHHLTPAERLDLFAGRRAELVRRRDQRRTAARSTGRVNAYLRSLLERDTESITADLAWLDRMIDLERGGGAIPDRRATPTSTDTGGSR